MVEPTWAKCNSNKSLFSFLDKTGLKPSHPSYVGAWWLGMVILGTLSLGLTVPMAMFPKHLRHYYVNRRQQRQNDMEAPAENGLGSHLKG